ncbi:MAG: PQQ-binding-like beta-propeller repeat protein, partial [Actinomycetes bacterium]
MELSRRTLLGALPVAAAAAACTRDPGPAGPPPELRRFASDWPLSGHDAANTRAVTSSVLDRSTVGRLQMAWSTPLPGTSAFSNVGTTPLVLGDTVLVQDLNSNVRAVDRRTGTVRWTRAFDRVQIGPNGVAAGWGKVFAGTGGTRVSAMDLSTGTEVWSRQLPRTGPVTVGVKAQVADGLVLVSTVPGDPEQGGYLGGARGVIYALDPTDGRTRWSLDTVKGDLWGNPRVNAGGGVWFPPAVDTARGVAYYGTGNPAPFPGDEQYPNGSSRPGPNLYTNCVLAVRLRDGKLLWHYQASPHDLFDHDLMLTAIATAA